MKATKPNYIKICRAMYEATENIYWLHKPEFDAQMKENFFICFWQVFSELKTFVYSGGVFKHQLICNGSPVPFAYNSLSI